MNRDMHAMLDGKLPTGARLIDIREDQPENTISVLSLPGGGSHVTGGARSCLRVRLVFLLPDPDLLRRQRAMEGLNAWCLGQRLTLSTRPGQYLMVRCTRWPRVSRASAWSEEVTVELSAFRVPCWRSVSTAWERLAGSNVTGQLYLPGTAPAAPVEVEAVNTSGATCQTLVLICGDTMLRFSHLGLESGEALEAVYDDARLLQLRISGENGTRSAFGARMLSSDDELLGACGRSNRIGFVASVCLTVTFSGQGMYL